LSSWKTSLVVFRVGTEPLDIDKSCIVGNFCNQSVIVAFYVENDMVVGDKTGRSVAIFYIHARLPR